MTAKPAAIQFVSVTKRFGSQQVLKGISLSTAPGEFLGLVGVNGAGKTTLIKCLLDFAEPDAGTIDIFGLTHRQPQARRTMAFLPERFVPPYFLTGGDFLRYMARFYGTPFDAAAAAETVSGLDMDPAALDKPVRALSKGMAQKLGLVAALLSGKDLLVLDEPMSGLDPKARALFKRRLLALKACGRTLFFSTHMLPDVQELCDRMAVLHEGNLAFVGSPDEFRERYGVENLEEAYLRCVSPERAVA
jgi:ABC-2 type transport system ATP-binding protein